MHRYCNFEWPKDGLQEHAPCMNGPKATFTLALNSLKLQRAFCVNAS